MSKDFAKAKEAYLKGDSRKLVDFVRANRMTDEEAAFVAQALAGEVKTDGRSEKNWTRNLYLDYVEIQAGGVLKEQLFGKKDQLSKTDIYRALAELHGYSDEDAVKKAIARAKNRRDGIATDYGIVFKRVIGQGQTLIFPDESPNPDVTLLDALIEALIDKKIRDENKKLDSPFSDDALEKIIDNRAVEAKKRFRDTT